MHSVIELLVEKGVDINAVDNNGYSVLMIVAYKYGGLYSKDFSITRYKSLGGYHIYKLLKLGAKSNNIDIIYNRLRIEAWGVTQPPDVPVEKVNMSNEMWFVNDWILYLEALFSKYMEKSDDGDKYFNNKYYKKHIEEFDYDDEENYKKYIEELEHYYNYEDGGQLVHYVYEDGENDYINETTNKIYDVNTGEMVGEWDKIAKKPKFWSDSKPCRYLPPDDDGGKNMKVKNIILMKQQMRYTILILVRWLETGIGVIKNLGFGPTPKQLCISLQTMMVVMIMFYKL